MAEAALRLLPLGLQVEKATTYQPIPAAVVEDPAWEHVPRSVYRDDPGVKSVHYSLALDVDRTIHLAEHDSGSYRFRTNNLGLRRDGQTTIEKPPGVFRVLVLGDSHTEGYVDNAENFSTLLEEDLTGQVAAAGRRLEVLNAGVGGYSPQSEAEWFLAHGAALKPDLVLLVFYPGNDLEWWHGEWWKSAQAEKDRAKAERERALGSRQLLHEIRLLSLARNSVYAGPFVYLWRELFPLDDPMVQVMRACPGCYNQSLVTVVQGPRERDALQAAITDTAAILINLSSDVSHTGGLLAVAILPTRFQVEPERAGPDLRAAAALLGLDEVDLANDDQIASGMLERLRLANVPTIPLQEPLRAAGQGQSLCYSRDWHLNAQGHCATARALEQAILDLDVLPTRP